MALVNLFIYAKNIRPFVLVESSSDEVYSIQNYVIKFVSDLDRSVVFSGHFGFLDQ
jgi:hypothetical protein